MNAVEIEEAVSQLAEQPFDAAEFPFAFLAAFGNKETTIKRLRSGNNNASDVAGGVLQRNNIHMAVCGEGAVAETLTALRDSPRTAANKVRFVLATDGRDFQAEDLASGEHLATAGLHFCHGVLEAFHGRLVDDRPDEDPVLAGDSHRHICGPGDQLVDEGLVYVVFDVHP